MKLGRSKSGGKFKLKSKVWLYPGMGGWHFVTIEKKIAREIDKHFGIKKRGWGSIRVLAKIRKSEWRTSIFPDRKNQTYLLAIKAQVRKKESIKLEDTVSVEIEIL